MLDDIMVQSNRPKRYQKKFLIIMYGQTDEHTYPSSKVTAILMQKNSFFCMDTLHYILNVRRLCILWWCASTCAWHQIGKYFIIANNYIKLIIMKQRKRAVCKVILICNPEMHISKLYSHCNSHLCSKFSYLWHTNSQCWQ